MKKFTMFGALFLSFTLCLSSVAFAHPGRTDAYGGHYDRKTGLYHYHNSGTVSAPKTTTTTPSVTTPKATVSTPKTTTTTPKTTVSAPKATTTTPKTTTTAPKTAASTPKATEPAPSPAKEVNATVIVDRVEVAGPILQYKDMYYVSLEQLANLMPSIITYTYYPVIFSFDVSLTEKKCRYIDEDLVFINFLDETDTHYHLFDCYQVQTQGSENYCAFHRMLLDYIENDLGYSPCPKCMYYYYYPAP